MTSLAIVLLRVILPSYSRHDAAQGHYVPLSLQIFVAWVSITILLSTFAL